jgi:hypothetical protein
MSNLRSDREVDYLYSCYGSKSKHLVINLTRFSNNLDLNQILTAF